MPPTQIPFYRLPWETRFFKRFPADAEEKNFTRQVHDVTHSGVLPTPVFDPKLIGWAGRLGEELGIAKPLLADPESLALLAGNLVLPTMRPYAARYGGHQFGNWAGQLGDGRAITLGEVKTRLGRMEFQLKGAGPTPYSRRADGRAVLRSSVREFLCSEAMHFLGVPTTRALSLVTTGEEVMRDLFYDGNPRAEPGAIVCRVSPSFLRFGNFQILAAAGEYRLLKELTDFLIEDHYPSIPRASPDTYGLLLDEIGRRTARLMVEWMRVGFVHGVMNTDNMSVLGLTMDYGPYGWLEPYDPQWTPNTTDSAGRRYSFGNQPGIGQWNFARLCEALHPLIQDEERLKQCLETYRVTYEAAYSEMIAAKLGIAPIQSEDDHTFIAELFELLHAVETDYTLFFRALCAPLSTGNAFLTQIAPAFYSREPLAREIGARWLAWSDKYLKRVHFTGFSETERTVKMKSVNPKFIFRNYLAQNAILAAEKRDPSVIERLLHVLETPYAEHPEDGDLSEKRPEWARTAPGCSALSCSS